jgi:hypothetical protein
VPARSTATQVQPPSWRCTAETLHAARPARWHRGINLVRTFRHYCSSLRQLLWKKVLASDEGGDRIPDVDIALSAGASRGSPPSLCGRSAWSRGDDELSAGSTRLHGGVSLSDLIETIDTIDRYDGVARGHGVEVVLQHR